MPCRWSRQSARCCRSSWQPLQLVLTRGRFPDRPHRRLGYLYSLWLPLSLYTIADTGQIWLHSPQPVQSDSSMATFPSTVISAGHPISRMHFLHWIHLSDSVIFLVGLLTAMQGDLKIIAFTPGSAAHSLTVCTALSNSSGSTTSIFFMPIPSRMRTMLTLSTTFPIILRPVPGCGWCPVMAVVELSSTHKIMSASL